MIGISAIWASLYLSDIWDLAFVGKDYPFPCECCGWRYNDFAIYVISGFFQIWPVFVFIPMLVMQ